MQYTLIINFSSDTVEELNKGNYSLCCFLAYTSPNASQAEPLCWGVTKNFLNSVLIQWNDTLFAYISTSPITENQVIYIPELASSLPDSKTTAGTITEIKLKQRMVIQNYGVITIDTKNDAENVLIQNNSVNPYSSGICVCDASDDLYYGIAVFSTFGGHNIQIAPDNKAFLMFSSKNIQNNTVISISENPGILIDFNTSVNNSRTVWYDINTGWSSDDSSWGITYPSGTNLNDLLGSTV